jgi:hypothetical protein
MRPSSSLARKLFRWSALLALPGGLWTAFEMYGLTLRGPQMLFFSIVHTLPPAVLAVVLSAPMGILWLAQSVLALVHPAYRTRLAIPRLAHAIFVTVIAVQSVLLAEYESWANDAALRVPLCVLGLALTGLVARESWRWLRFANPGTPAPVSKPERRS